jgi:hypothetical protein
LNAGLIPSATENSVTMYAKAFGQIDVQGQDSIYSFDTYTGTINSNVQLIGSGAINISTDTVLNKIKFYSPDDAISSLSTAVANFTGINNSLSNTITSFNSPFSTFIYNAISSYSTVQGPLVNALNFSNVLSTNNNVVKFNTGILNVSTLNMLNYRQPFIQYGSSILDGSSRTIALNSNYIDSNYIIQVTYLKGDNPPVIPLSFNNITRSNFIVHGDSNSRFHWTTYGNAF